MRTLPRAVLAVLLVGVLAIGVVLIGGSTTALAGGRQPQITVTKSVTGEAPEGARYRVRLDCAGNGRDAEVVFGGPGSETVDAPCARVRAVETETGGARAVTYSCAASGGARCISDDTIEFVGGGSGQRGSFSVTNAFNPPTTSTSTTSTSTTSTTTTSTTSTTAPTTSTTVGTTSSSTSTTLGTTPGTVVARSAGDGGDLGLILAIIAAIVFAAGAAAIAVYLIKSRNQPDDGEGFGPGSGSGYGNGGGYGAGGGSYSNG